MSFNTLCDFCTKKNHDDFDMRQYQISKVIRTHRADLISLQEIRTGSQVKEIFSNLSHYTFIYPDSWILSYADAALAINTKRFEIIESGHLWLGPNNGNFTFGWKVALPRVMVWSKIKEIKTQKELLFIGSHFDNRVENMIGSAKLVNDFIKKKNLPVIFAADTNATTDFEGYKILEGKSFANSFNLTKRNIASSNSKDLCYSRKGDHFPTCRVDHILYSKNSIFKPVDWTIDTSRFGKNQRFPSDHRAVVATFTLID